MTDVSEWVAQLRTAQGPLLGTLDARSIDALTARVGKDSDVEVRLVRGAQCRSSDALFREFAAALQFPYYFGNNWSAFEDSLRDLSWLRTSQVALVVADADDLCAAEPDKLGVFADILGSRIQPKRPRVPVVRALFVVRDPTSSPLRAALPQAPGAGTR